jgi:8-oxo-dGTP pyrophosphatase MutT (NUDIX family)
VRVDGDRAVTFAEVVARLEAGFKRELPGPAAQVRLAPVPRRKWPVNFDAARIRHAAGLLLLFPAQHAKAATGAKNAEKDATAHLILTVRSESLRRHSGQVSLPGGVLEPGETFEQAALREAHEEISLPLDIVRIVGALTPLDIPVSGFRLHPIVAVANARPALTPVDGEVARILEIGVDALLDPAALLWLDRERDGAPLKVPAFDVAGHEIWGATAMVIAEFLSVLGWNPSATS